MTYYSRKDYPYNGGDKFFTITFPYIKKEHIEVYVNEVKTTNFMFLTDAQISVTDSLSVGDIVSLRRNTPIDDRMVKFTNTSILSKDNQNLAQEQMFYAVQENTDNNEEFVEIAANVKDSLIEINLKTDEARGSAKIATEQAVIATNKAQDAIEATGKIEDLADKDLSNLSDLGNSHFSNKDLSNLSEEGKARLADKFPRACVNSAQDNSLLSIKKAHFKAFTPTMTSKTSPYGTVTSTGTFDSAGGFPDFKAFTDGVAGQAARATSAFTNNYAFKDLVSSSNGLYIIKCYLSAGSTKLDLNIRLVYEDNSTQDIPRISTGGAHVFGVNSDKKVKELQTFSDVAAGFVNYRVTLYSADPTGDVEFNDNKITISECTYTTPIGETKVLNETELKIVPTKFKALIPPQTSATEPSGSVQGAQGDPIASTTGYWNAWRGDSTVSMSGYAMATTGQGVGFSVYTPDNITFPKGQYVLKAGTGYRADSAQVATSISFIGVRENDTQVELYRKDNIPTTQPQYVYSPVINTVEDYKHIIIKANSIYSALNNHCTFGNCQVFKEDPDGDFSFEETYIAGLGSDNQPFSTKSAYTKGASFPESPEANQYHFITDPTKFGMWQYVNGVWTQENGAAETVFLGEVSLSNGMIASVKDLPFNCNGYEAHPQAVVTETYRNGSSWYRRWSDGWIEQGGIFDNTTSTTITFPQAFKNSNYTCNAILKIASGWYAPSVSEMAPTYMKVDRYNVTLYNPIIWTAQGY